jgi:hypothetical protein
MERADRPDVRFAAADGPAFAAHSALLRLRWPAFARAPEAAVRALASLPAAAAAAALEFLYGGLPVHDAMREPFRRLELAFPPADPAPAYRADMRRLFTSGAGADFAVESGGRRYPVHRFVLAIRSAYFAALLESGLAEAAAGAFRDRAPTRPAAMQAFLAYLYCGDCEFPETDDALAFVELCARFRVHAGARDEHALFAAAKLMQGAAPPADVLERARRAGCQEIVSAIEACDL